MTEEKKTFFINATRNYRPFGMLMHAARSLGEIGQSGQKGSGWANVGGLVLLAFGIEAFCQEQGPKLFEEAWPGADGVERKPVHAKLKLIGAKLGVVVDYGKHPWSDIRALLRVRDSLAHPKPSDDQKIVQLMLDDEEQANLRATNVILQPWEVMSEPAHAAKIEENVRAAMETLLVAMGTNKWEMEFLGSGSYSMSTGQSSQGSSGPSPKPAQRRLPADD